MARPNITARAADLINARLYILLLLLSAAFSATAEDCSEYPGSVLDDSTATSPGIQFVHMTKRDFGTFEIEMR